MRKRVLGLLLGAAVAGALMTGCSGGGQELLGILWQTVTSITE